MSLIPETRVRVVAASFFVQAIIIGCMFGYGVYFKVLEAEFGWSRTLLSGASSLAFLMMGILAYVGGRISDKYGPRWVLSVTGLMTGVGYMLMSKMDQPWQLLLYMGFFIGLGLSTHDVVTLSTIASWYNKKRGMVTGIVKTGTACGQMLIPLLITAMIALYGWRTSMMTIGIAVAVLLVFFAQFIRRADPQMAADGKPAMVLGLTIKEARRTRTLWTLCAIQFCFFPALMSIPLHAVVHATDLGMSTERAATLLAMIGGLSIIGRMAMGHMLDKLGGRYALLLCLGPLALCLFSLLWITNPAYLYLFAPVYGIAHGGLFTVVSPAVAEFFGMKAHGAIFGMILFFGTLGGSSGPLMAGYIFDQFGSYNFAFIILGTLAAIGFMLATTLKPVVTQEEA